MKKKSLILFSLLAFCSIAFAGYDVNDVLIEGDSTLMGMKIKSSHIENGAFLIETTGARYEYVKGQLKLYQGLDAKSRRLLSIITFDNEPNFIKVESNEDHILFWSRDLNLGIYGDSTCIISPKIKQSLKCRGNFKPDYEGRYKGELLLIDDKGGMEIYPQRYETGYEIKNIELSRQNWIADYELNAGERVMLAAFPGRPFDWDKSFLSNVISTEGFPTGQLPGNAILRNWSKSFHTIAVFFEGLYKSEKPYGPYELLNEKEFVRFLSDSRSNNLKVLAFCSPFYFYRYNKSLDRFWLQLKKLKNTYNIDGFYIDGLLFDHKRDRIDDKIQNYQIIRLMRGIVGKDGVLMYHGTSSGQSVGTIPNVDSYCDITLNGENVTFTTLDDKYINYNVKKYGISNTIAMWKTGPHPKSITRRDIIDKIISINARERMWGYLIETKDMNGIKYHYWPTTFNLEYDYYLKKSEDYKAICPKGIKSK